jgi:hypothetical protein
MKTLATAVVILIVLIILGLFRLRAGKTLSSHFYSSTGVLLFIAIPIIIILWIWGIAP